MKIKIVILFTFLVLSCNRGNRKPKPIDYADTTIYNTDSVATIQNGNGRRMARNKASRNENNGPVADFSKLEMNRFNDTIEYRYNLGTNISGANELEYLLSEYALNVVPPDTNYSVVKHIVMIRIYGKPTFRKYIYICKSGTLSFDLTQLHCSNK